MRAIAFVFFMLMAASAAMAASDEKPAPAVCKADLKTWSGQNTETLKSRAKDALGNRFAIPTFPQLRRRPHLSLDDHDHFLQNPPASVASLRRLITSLRNADHDPPEPRLPSPESPYRLTR
jgi:hypothetical protein